MEPAPARRALAVALAAALGAAGCGGAAGSSPGAASAADRPTPGGVTPAPSAEREIVTEGEPEEVHARLARVLGSAGHTCRVGSDRVLCKGEGEHASYYVVYRAYPARLLFGSPWMLKGECAAAVPAINRFNWSFDELGASCDERGTLVVSGAYFVPAAGLTPDDVRSFARWWTLAEVRALQSSELGALLQ